MNRERLYIKSTGMHDCSLVCLVLFLGYAEKDQATRASLHEVFESACFI